jgi:predicted AlkP superfamily pyrophosphatase or phosphodiesterase
LDEIAEVYDPVAAFPRDKFWPQFEAGFYPGRGGDLLIRLKEGVVVEKYGSKTTHGSPYDYDNRVPLIFWGPDFKPGRYPSVAQTMDIAPTLAKILGLNLDPATGSRILTEAIKSETEAEDSK